VKKGGLIILKKPEKNILDKVENQVYFKLKKLF